MFIAVSISAVSSNRFKLRCNNFCQVENGSWFCREWNFLEKCCFSAGNAIFRFQRQMEAFSWGVVQAPAAVEMWKPWLWLIETVTIRALFEFNSPKRFRSNFVNFRYHRRKLAELQEVSATKRSNRRFWPIIETGSCRGALVRIHHSPPCRWKSNSQKAGTLSRSLIIEQLNGKSGQ